MIRVSILFVAWLWIVGPVAAQDNDSMTPPRKMVIVVGTGGEPEYGTMFGEWATHWKTVADSQKMQAVVIGLGDAGETTDRDQLLQSIAPGDAIENCPQLWLVMIGHGTYDGDQAKFNLRGPDLAASELQKALAPIETQMVIINCASSSGPFINALSGPNRVVVTATRSGVQYNFSRFGKYLASSIHDSKADLDKDGQTSVLEGFIAASAGVAEFYDSEKRLASELALIDDNGDSLGTPADWFRGVRAIKTAKSGAVDGRLANTVFLVPSDRESNLPLEIRQRREQLEAEVESLRVQKSQMVEAEYYQELESLMVELARLGQ